LGSRRENLVLAVPRAEQVPLKELLQRVPDLVGASGFELLRGVERGRELRPFAREPEPRS
jgi:hypothetical protein